MASPEYEIVIQSPKGNQDPQRRYTSSDINIPGFKHATGDNEGKDLAGFLKADIFSPQDFPKVVDLFAGDGSWAQRLVSSGWKTEDITCIDRAQTETPLVGGLNWHYWDLALLARVIKDGNIMPDEVLGLKGKFDLAFLSFGACYLPSTAASPDDFCGFFLRNGGLAYIEGDLKQKGEDGKLIPLPKFN